MLRYIQAAPYQPEEIKTFVRECGTTELIASALMNRGIQTKAQAEAFLRPSFTQLHDPLLMPDMQSAVDIIRSAIEQSHCICVYGDYDADGVCATAMLYRQLRRMGARAEYYLPSRHGAGYGMHPEAVRELHRRGVQLVITVDNGISALEEVALCYELGMRVIVTDHHQCPGELPACEAILNPNRADGAYPNRSLCGAGVVLKLIHALAGEGACWEHLALCALATVADVVPLLGENRAIVALGLPAVVAHTGLHALLEVSGSGGQPVTSDLLAYRLAPRINAAGRMGSAEEALALLLAEEAEEAKALALSLNDANEERQKQEQAILRAAREQLRGRDVARMRAIMLYDAAWSPGVIGIVASRLREEYYRPVLLFHQSGGLLTGSCRSIPGVDLYQCLQAFSEYFVKYGGHAQAAGITMERARFEEFQACFDLYLRENIPSAAFVPAKSYEREIPFAAASIAEVESLAALAPHGEGNPQPVFRTRNILLRDVERMGKEKTHLRATAVQNSARLQMVAFGYGHMAEELQRGGKQDVLYALQLNEWQGVKKLQVHLRAIRETQLLAEENSPVALGNYFYDAFFCNFLYNDTQGIARAQANWRERLKRSLQKDCCGTLVYCFTPQGASRVQSSLREWGALDQVQAFLHRPAKGAPAYHTVVLAPVLRDCDTEAYAEVICADAYDEPLESGGDSFLAPLRIGRGQMAELYGRMLRMLRDAPMQYKALLKGCGAAGYEAALLALAVFIELGFFSLEGATGRVSAVENCPQRALSESGLYAGANV